MVWPKIPVFVATITNKDGPTSSENNGSFGRHKTRLENPLFYFKYTRLSSHKNSWNYPQVYLWFCWADFDPLFLNCPAVIFTAAYITHNASDYMHASSGATKVVILLLKTGELILSGVWTQVSAVAVPVDDQGQRPVRALHQTDGLLTGAAEGHGVNAHQLITNLETHCCRHAALLHLDTHTHTNITTKSPSSVEEEEGWGGEKDLASLFIQIKTLWRHPLDTTYTCCSTRWKHFFIHPEVVFQALLQVTASEELDLLNTFIMLLQKRKTTW